MVTLTGKFVYEDSTPVANGILVLTLSQPCSISGTAQVAPLRKVVQLDAAGTIPGSTQVYGNDALTPAGTTYQAVLYTGVLNAATGLYSPGAQLFNQNWSLTGASVAVDTLTPTTNGASYVAPVTSIGLTMPGEFAVANSPVTTAGTFVVTKVNQSPNQVYAGPPSGGAAAPGFRALVDADIPTTMANKSLTTPTLTNPKLAASSTIKDSAGAASMGVTMKVGTGLGDYSTASLSYVDVDATNLAYTVTIPTGWKLLVIASGNCAILTAVNFIGISIFDGSTLVEQFINLLSVNQQQPFSLQYVINGDGASHTVKLQYKTANASDSAKVNNSSSTNKPVMTFLLMPSN